MDLNQVMQLAGNPQVRQLLQSILTSDGGWQGLMSRLQQAGLGGQVQSWLSDRPNQPVSGQQIQQALGPNLHQAAEAAGLAPDEAAGDLAKVVPTVVDEASPNGQLDMNTLQHILKELTDAK